MAEQPSTEQPVDSAVEPADNAGLGGIAVLDDHRGNAPAKVEVTPQGRRLFRPPAEQQQSALLPPRNSPAQPLGESPLPPRRLFRPGSFQPEVQKLSEQSPAANLVEVTPQGRRLFRPPAEQQQSALLPPRNSPAQPAEAPRSQRRLFGTGNLRQTDTEDTSGGADIISMPTRDDADKTKLGGKAAADDDTHQAVGRVVLLPRDRGPTKEMELDDTRVEPDATQEIVLTNPNEVQLPGGHQVTVANPEPGAESYVTSWTKADGKEVQQQPRRLDIREDRQPADPTLVSGNYDNTEALERLPAPVLSSNKDFIARYNKFYPATPYDRAHPSPEDQHPYNIHRNGWLRATAVDAAKGLAARARKVFDGAVGAVGLDKMVERANGPSPVQVEVEAPVSDNTSDSPEAKAELEEVTFYRKLNEQIADDEMPAAIESAQRLLDAQGRKPGTIRFVMNAFLSKRKGHGPSPEALKYVTTLASGDIDASPEESLQVRTEILETLDHFREPDATVSEQKAEAPAPTTTPDDSEAAEVLSAVG